MTSLLEVEDVDEGLSLGASSRRPSKRHSSRVPKADAVGILPWTEGLESPESQTAGGSTPHPARPSSSRDDSAFESILQRQLAHLQGPAVPLHGDVQAHGSSVQPTQSKLPQERHGRRPRSTSPNALYRLPAISLKPKSPPLLTAQERTRTRNEDPAEVFSESSKRFHRVHIHDRAARTPTHLAKHQQRISKSGGGLSGPLTTWDGLMDDNLSVRFVPARIANMYTARNAMTKSAAA